MCCLLRLLIVFIACFSCPLIASAAVVWTESTTSPAPSCKDVASNLDDSVLVCVGLLRSGSNRAAYSTDAGVTWTDSTTVIGKNLSGVAYGNGLFVAIGGNALYTSADGITWTTRTSPSTGNLFAIAFDGSKFLALDGSKVYSSADGISWSQIATLSLSFVRRVIWTGKAFLAVGWSAVASSSDGVHWTTTTISDGSNGFNGVASNGAVHVIVGKSGRIWSTTDGANWFKRPSPTTDELQDVVWDGAEFVAVGWNGAIMKSADGITWSYDFMIKANGGSPSGLRYGLLRAGRKLIAVGQTPSFVATLPTLIPWHNTTSTTTPFWRLDSFKGIASDGAGRFVAVSQFSTGAAFSSTDGVAWSKSTWAPPTGAHLQSVDYDSIKKEYIAVGGSSSIDSSTPLAFTSSDGVTWSTVQIGSVANAGALYGVDSFGTWRVAVGGKGSVYKSSVSGTWSKQTTVNTTTRLTDIACIGNNTTNTCVAVHFTGVWVSTNRAATWTAQTVDSTNKIRLRTIADNGTLFVAAGYNGGASTGTQTVATSTDGVTWTMVDVGVTNEIKDIIYDVDNARFIAVGQNGMTLVSADGSQWDSIDSGVGALLQGVAWNGTRYVAVGDNAAKALAENDVTNPSLSSVIIENGATDTNQQYATVAIACSDGAYGSGCDSMRFSNDNINWSEWVPFSTSAVIDLTSGDASKDVYAQVRDLAMHLSTSVKDSITLDTVAPNAPILASPANNAYVTSSTFTASGAAGANEIVQLFEGINQIGTTTANSSGNWSIISNSLSDAIYSITAKAKDVAGNLSTATAAVSITIDTVKPRLQSTASQSDAIHVDVTFDESVSGATTVGNFSGSNGLTLASVVSQGNNVYRLTTSHQTHGVSYNITASNITDLAGNTLNTNNSVAVITRTSNNAPSLTGPVSSQSVNEDTALTFVLSASDADNDVLTYGTVSGASHGSVGVNAQSGSVTYMPSLNYSGVDGFVLKVTDEAGAVSTRTFNITINAVNDSPYFTGTPSVTGTLRVGQVLSVINDGYADVDSVSVTRSYQWIANGSNILGATASIFTLVSSQAHQPMACKITLNDGSGGVTMRTVVAGTVGNSVPSFTGTPAMNGTFKVGNVITVNGTGINDGDGDSIALHYQWKINGLNVGIDAASYTIFAVNAHQPISCVVTADDGNGGVASNTIGVQTIQNSTPTFVGTPWIGGLARTVGSTLTANVAGTSDVDGDSVALTYQWRSAGINVNGATSSTYMVQAVDAHHTIDVIITATDNHTTPANVSYTTTTVTVLNSAPQFAGTLAISGTPTVGSTLTVTGDSYSDADSDAVTTSYQWQAGGVKITSANGRSVVLTSAEAHANISMVVTLADGNGGITTASPAQSVTVGNTVPVLTLPVISGSAMVGSQFSVTPTASDADGDTINYSYQWQTSSDNGITFVPISGATLSVLSLTAAQAHQQVRVAVIANDGKGGTHTLRSVAQQVGNSAPAFTGTLAITGSARVGSTLSVTATGASDVDNDTISLNYQWRIGGVNGATTPTYTIASADSHQNIVVIVTASDAYTGAASATTAAVSVLNSAPQFAGTLAISGTPTVGSTLTVTGDSYSDADSDAVTTSYQWQAGGVKITSANGRSVVLTSAEAHANISVVVSLDDGNGGITTASPAQSVTVSNAKPVFAATPTVLPSAPKVGAVLSLGSASATDADGDPLSYSYQWQASVDGYTFVSIANANAATLVLDASDARKSIRCLITVDDGKQGVITATSTAVMSGNTPPVAKDDVTSPMIEDAQIPATIAVLLNDQDADGDALMVQSYDATSALGGTLSLNGDGTINYTPAANATGSDSFNYVVTDGYATATARVTIEIIAVNDPPQVNADATLMVNEDPAQAASSVDVLANDIDIDGDPLAIVQFDLYSVFGGVVDQYGGVFRYTPAPNFYGSDSISYTVSDGQGGLTAGVLLIDVASVNDAPTAIALSSSAINENLPAGSVVGTLSVSDVDLPADSYSFVIIGGADPYAFGINGVDLYATASFNFEGKASYSIQLQVTDGYGASFAGPFTIAVNDINEPPTAVSATASTQQSKPVVIVPAVTDPDLNDLHRFTVIGAVTGGTVAFQNNQTELVYTPNAFFNGNDSFTIEATDAGGNTVRGSVTVSVAANPALAVITSLSLDLSRQNIQPTEAIDVFGKLTTVSNAAGVKIYGQPLVVTVQDAYSVQTFTTTVNDVYGHFVLGGMNAFPTSGDYTVQVDFTGIPGVLAQASSAVRSVLVGASAGYAIIIEGRLSTNEGLESHNKTLDRAYDKLIDRGFDKRNIRYLNFDTTRIGQDVYAAPTRALIQDAIENWAAQRMRSVPAPLYLIMVDHGSIDTFYIEPEIITPTDLNGWLNTLDGKLAGSLAASEKKVIIYGACYSGSFIPTIAKPGRIIISSAAADEVSYKGPLEPDNIRSGEYFMESFFERLGKGDSVGLAFTKATKETEEYTKKGDGISSNSKYGDGGAQHPLIDANGDGVGVNELLEGVGDDLYARSLFLGRGATYNTNAAYSVAEVVATVPTQHLDAQSSAIQLWAKANNDAQVNSLWMEIRTPAMQLLTKNSTVQVATGFTKKPLQLIGGKWSASAADFVASGKYEVFFFARDDGPLKDGTGPVSPMKRSVVYKNYAGNAVPSAVTLNSPVDGYTIPTSSLFNWGTSTDPDGVSYTFTIASDAAMTQVIYRQEELATTYALVDGKAGLVDGLTYFWRVDAVDGFGAISSSPVRTFTTGNTNSASGTVSVKVLDATTSGKITGATISITASNGGSYSPALTAGNLSLFMGVPNGTVTVTVTATGYYAKSIGKAFNAGDALVVNAMMVLKPGKDAVPPVVTAPADVTVEATGVTTQVTMGSATVTDNRDKNLVATASVIGSFALGATSVTWSAVDGSNNSASATQVVTVVDSTPATIALNGAASMTVEAGTAYSDQGAIATDLVDGGNNIAATGSVDTSKVGVYPLHYDYTDGTGNVSATVIRTVTVVDRVAPVFTTTPSDLYVEATGITTPVSLPALFATDLGLNIAAVPDVMGPFSLGATTVTFTATDSAVNSATTSIRVVVQDTTAPVITVQGSNPIVIDQYAAHTDAGATALDLLDGVVAVTVSGAVDSNTAGSYQVRYTVTDNHGNSATAVRDVIVLAKVQTGGGSVLNITQGDSDGDGVPDSLDKFPADPAAVLDSDGDGFPDRWNAIAQQSMIDASTLLLDAFINNARYHADSDNDGMADRWEMQFFGDLTTANAVTDSDGDGMTDLTEFGNGSDPTFRSDTVVTLGDGYADAGATTVLPITLEIAAGVQVTQFVLKINLDLYGLTIGNPSSVPAGWTITATSAPLANGTPGQVILSGSGTQVLTGTVRFSLPITFGNLARGHGYALSVDRYSSASNQGVALTLGGHDGSLRVAVSQPVSITLTGGWNLIAVANDARANGLQNLLAAVPQIQSIWQYTANGWNSYLTSLAGMGINTLTSLKQNSVYWLKLPNNMVARQITLTGITPLTVTAPPLVTGWNMIVADGTTTDPATYLASHNASQLWSYRNGVWSSFISGAPAFLNSLATLAAGQGYYVLR